MTMTPLTTKTAAELQPGDRVVVMHRLSNAPYLLGESIAAGDPLNVLTLRSRRGARLCFEYSTPYNRPLTLHLDDFDGSLEVYHITSPEQASALAAQLVRDYAAALLTKHATAMQRLNGAAALHDF